MRGFPTPSGLPSTDQATSVRPNAPENRPRPGTPALPQPGAHEDPFVSRNLDLTQYGLRRGDRVQITIVVDAVLDQGEIDTDGDLRVEAPDGSTHYVFGPAVPHTIQITKV